ncbi:MAG: ribonuclease P protein component [Caldimicrobium sp.]
MQKQGLSKKERLRLNRDFLRVFRTGKKIWIDKYLLVIYCPNKLSYRRLGIVVSKKIGKATLRNKVKRMLRELFRKNKEIFPEGIDIIMIASPNLQFITYEKLLELVKDYLSKENKTANHAKNLLN